MGLNCIGQNKVIGRLFMKVIVLIATFCSIMMISPDISFAKRGKIQFVSDVETEETLKYFVMPILRAAHLDPSLIQFQLIRDNSLNAFVIGGMEIYVHSGLIEKADNVGQLVGVFAHEIGHIAGGHVIKGTEAMKNANKKTLIAGLIGLGAGLASQNAEVGAAGVFAGMGVAQKSFLSFSRAQESSADQAALKYLSASGFSAQGFEDFFHKLADQELLPPERQDPFLRTHPMTKDRIESVRIFNEKSPYVAKPYPADYEEKFKRLRAKFLGYFHPQQALRKFKKMETIDEKYGYAYALFQQKKMTDALSIAEELLKKEPDNPFFHEFKGQLLFQHSKIADAITSYKRAVQLLPDSPGLRLDLVHAMLETESQQNWIDAETHLKRVLHQSLENSHFWQLLATDMGKLGRKGEMHFAMAKKYHLLEENDKAKGYLKLAIAETPKNSPYFIQLQDLKYQVLGEEDDTSQKKSKKK